ncbi:MAG: class I SAM-dependent methyltransferase [Actinomycetota bacterium]|nr:class I SAM-dependent methyltransferase [Actinomycetota bacterium]
MVAGGAVKNPSVTHRKDEGIQYAGLKVHAPPGIHEDAMAILMRHIKKGSHVIELGAGSGAFTKRMLDADLQVDCVDLDPPEWIEGSVEVIRRDLNLQDWKLPEGRYDAVVAIEVLEHVENPSAFIRNARKIVKPGGVVLVTTPNVISVESRKRMLRSGEFAFFGIGELHHSGHLSILPYWLMEELVRKEGFEVLEMVFMGRQKLFFRQGRQWWKHLLIPPVEILLYLIGRRAPKEAAFSTNLAMVIRPTN